MSIKAAGMSPFQRGIRHGSEWVWRFVQGYLIMFVSDNVCLPGLELNMTATKLKLFVVAGLVTATVSLAGCSRTAVDSVDPGLDADQTLSAKELGEGATPILISVSDKKLTLTDAAHGVTFDIDNNGSGDHV